MKFLIVTAVKALTLVLIQGGSLNGASLKQMGNTFNDTRAVHSFIPAGCVGDRATVLMVP